MGVLGRYVDALPDGAKDRIIRAQEWEGNKDPNSGAIDVIYHVEAPRSGGAWERMIEMWTLRVFRLLTFGPLSRRRLRRRFDRLVRRYGRERAVRLLKVRAAKHFMLRLDRRQQRS